MAARVRHLRLTCARFGISFRDEGRRCWRLETQHCCQRSPSRGAASLLPRVLLVDAAALALSTWLEPVLLTLASQAEDRLPGTPVMQAKIAEVFIAEALRSWLTDAQRSGLIVDGEFVDEPVAQALKTIRERFDERWTLCRLATHVGLSRTALATRFKLRVGDSPMHYLTRARLSPAAGLLATTRLSHHEIAHLSGYATEAALAKAFKRERGEPPGAYRAGRPRSTWSRPRPDRPGTTKSELFTVLAWPRREAGRLTRHASRSL